MILQHARQNLALHRTALYRSSNLSLSGSVRRKGLGQTFGCRCVVTNPYRPGRSRLSDGSQRQKQDRSLATAVGDFDMAAFAQSQLSTPGVPPFSTNSIFEPFDASKPLILPEPQEEVHAMKTSRDGISGVAEEVFTMFDACIRVGQLERASNILKRARRTPGISPEDLIILHNHYLKASLRQIRATNDRDQVERLHKWYELEINSKGLPHTAETVACMLKASLLSERGTRLERLVRRYMDMAPGEAGLQVLNMADILSDRDLATITDICPTYNYAAELEEYDELLEAQVDEARSSNSHRNTPEYDELVPTPQRGEGLRTVRKGLELMVDVQNVDISSLPLADQRDIQLQMERDTITSALERWRLEQKDRSKRGLSASFVNGNSNSSMGSHMGDWLDSMTARYKKELELIAESEAKSAKSIEDHERCTYGPYLRLSDPQRMSAITIITLLSMGTTEDKDKCLPTSTASSKIGRHAHEDLRLQEREKKEKERRKRRVQMAADAKTQPAANAEGLPIFIQDSSQAESRVQSLMTGEWTTTVNAHVGSILLKIAVESATVKVVRDDPVTGTKVSQVQPAFTHTNTIIRGRKVGVIRMNPAIVNLMMREPLGDYLAKHVPMIVEPKPWTSVDEGGFLDSKTSVIRVQPGDIEQKLYLRAAVRNGDMKTVFKGLDVLGKTAWRINMDVLDVITAAWNTGHEVANIPPLHMEIEYPTEPDAIDDPDAHLAWRRKVKLLENKKMGAHSQRCFMNLQLEVARSFRNQRIFFPHNVDYRGRAYPMPTYLNHMGADHTRGLLRFDKGKELGSRGLRWLRIQLANVYGLDKSSFDEREAFAVANHDKIVDSATKPLDGERWWLGAEDPWQCLAACFELKAAMELPDPTKFISHLPVQQDGTCNGLQHYAALGGDTWGAQQVNLEPADRPADVYTAVANLVKEAIAEEAEQGNQMAKALKDKVARKVVKQTVMTNVYGVTFAGAKKQVNRQIDALYPNIGKEVDSTNHAVSTYIARHIFRALATMFRGAHDIQYWLNVVGGRVCRSLTAAQLDTIAEEFNNKTSNAKGSKKKASSRAGEKESHANKLATKDLLLRLRSTVVWTTPLRMPVVQPYRKGADKNVRTCLQLVSYASSKQTDPVHRRKQLQGFPPNFIHSLDASHMLLSALKCGDVGLEFAAVHDSFWTHACDVDTMNEVLRDSFIKIHSEDVMGRLAAEFKSRHQGSVYYAEIDPKSLVATKIKELRRSSKLSSQEELLLEHKRQTLLRSGNPWDLEAAKQIVTPASVYEDMAGDEMDAPIVDDIDVSETSLGAVPASEEAETDASHRVQEDGQDAAMETGDAPQSTAWQAPANFRKGSGLFLWLPLTFPPVPKKGDFDVSRLKESKYFFS